MTRRGAGLSPHTSGWWRPGMVGVWSVRVRHVLWLLLLWMVCGLHLLYLFASYGAQHTTSQQQQQQQQEQEPRVISGGLGLVRKHLEEKNGVRVTGTPGAGLTGAAHQQWLHLAPNTQEQDSEEGTWPRLEGQQLRHLADVDSLVLRNAENIAYNRLPPDNPSRGGEAGESVSDRLQGNVQQDHREAILLQHRSRGSSLPVRSGGNGTGTGSADQQSPNRPDTWIACPSVVAPNIMESSTTEGRKVKKEQQVDGQWQPVRPGQSYVFSAYQDPRPLILGGKARDGVVRVIGMTDTRVDGAPQFCQLWYAPPETLPPRRGSAAGGAAGSRRRRRGQYERRPSRHHAPTAVEDAQRTGNDTSVPRARLVVVPAISDIVPETHGLRFAPFIYTCRLGSGVLPVAVSMTHSRCDTPLNYLRIRRAHPAAPPPHHRYHPRHPHNYTVCVTPFNFNYNNVDQLVEKIEVDRVFGANRFIFYNYSSGADLAPYLRSYIDEGIAEVVQWRLPVRVDTWPASAAPEVDVHYFGQLAALNDCLYRAMFDSKMVVFTDMDELIVPKKHSRWREMVTFLQHKGQGSAGTFIFQNAFFRTEWADDSKVDHNGETDSGVLRIMSLAKTKRERYIYPWGMRSKFICDPLKVEMVGVHNIWRFVNESFTELDVPADVGLLHHYRSWNKVQEENSVLDRSMHSYYDSILSRVRERHVKVRESTRTLREFPVRPAER